jgi:hypothetical protein
LRLTLEPEAANAEREAQPASGIDTALGDAFNTYTRSNGEHATNGPLSEAVEEELGAHAVSPVKSRDLFAKRRATQSTAAEESEQLRGAIEASQKEWEDSERRKLELAQKKQPAAVDSSGEMDAVMRRLAPIEHGAPGEETAALADLLSTAVEGSPNKEVASLMGLLAKPNKPTIEKAENDSVIQAQIQGLMAELQAIKSRQNDEAKVKVIVYKDTGLAKLEEKVKHLVTVPYTASKANSADTETCLRGVDGCHFLHVKGKDCECGAPGSTPKYRC